MSKRPKNIRGGAGFYAVLLICLAVVGVASWYWLFNGKENSKNSPSTKTSETTVTQTSNANKSAKQAAASASISKKTDTIVPEKPTIQEGQENSTSTQTKKTPSTSASNLIVSPLNGTVVEAFSMDQLSYDETLGDWRTHDGVDITAAQGTNVQAACAGTVKTVKDDPMMGTMVVISHSGGYQTTYANLEAKPTVKEGDTVTAGQVIGAVGTTSIAESAEGPHLHFSVTKNGKTINPNTFLKK